ncbi:MAG: TonB family protein [Zoogloeaceae bacterium]|jgi:protein TonB|nr:TonB family protein [Zoogloeaceae bacterium]
MKYHLHFTLPLALTISLALHGVVLGVHFTLPKLEKDKSGETLNVILVNSRSAKAPRDAQARAQANLDGGGNSEDKKRMASTFLPVSRQDAVGGEMEATRRRVEQLEKRQQELLAQTRQNRETQRREKPKKTPAETPKSGAELADMARAMARLQARIDRNIEAYNSRPRKSFMGVRAKEYPFAQYEEDWRRKVERIGTLNYPEDARGRVYGSLILTVTLNAKGEIVDVSIDRSSGHAVLDQAAQRILRLSAPFAPFPPAIARDTDLLVITRTWTFTRSDSVVTK